MRDRTVVTPVNPLALAAHVASLLESLGIRYVIGGSVASSIHGEPRLTVDLDIMIDVDEAMATELAKRLSDEFYVDAEAARDAVRHGSTFNAIHLASAMKIDLFVAENDDAVRRQLERRVALRNR